MSVACMWVHCIDGDYYDLGRAALSLARAFRAPARYLFSDRNRAVGNIHHDRSRGPDRTRTVTARKDRFLGIR